MLFLFLKKVQNCNVQLVGRAALPWWPSAVRMGARGGGGGRRTALSQEPRCTPFPEPVCFHLNNSKALDPILFVTKALFTPSGWQDVRNKGLSGCSRQHWGVLILGLWGEQAGLGTPLGWELV